MKADESEFTSQVRSTLSAQKKLRQLNSILKKWNALADQNKSIYTSVEKLDIPVCEFKLHKRMVGRDHPDMPGFSIDDAWTRSDQDFNPTQTERETLEWMWKENRARELGMTHDIKYAPSRAADIQKQINQVEARMARLIGVK